MNRVIVDFIALLLPLSDREAVLGDLAESGVSLASSLFAILGFVLRRQFLCWLSWRRHGSPLLLSHTLQHGCSWVILSISAQTQ